MAIEVVRKRTTNDDDEGLNRKWKESASIIMAFELLIWFGSQKNAPF